MIQEVDTAGFTAMATELAKLSGKEIEDVIVNQVGKLLKACVRRTPARTPGVIVKYVSRRNGRIIFDSGHEIRMMKAFKNVGNVAESAVMFLDDSNFVPKKGQKAPRLEGGKSWHDMSKKRWSLKRWQLFLHYNGRAKKLRARQLEDSMAARGLAKKSWYQILLQMGLDTDGIPAYVGKAKGPGDRSYAESLAKEILEQAAFYIEVRNWNPLMVGRLNGNAIIQGAIADRLKAFSIEMEKGVFADMAMRAKRYPGIFTN